MSTAPPAPSAPRSAGEARGRLRIGPSHSLPTVRRRSRRRRRLARTLLVAAAGAVVVALVASSGGRGPKASAVTVRVTLPGTARVPAASASTTLPWPAAGQAAVAIPAVGYRSQSGPEHAVPVASLTKLMTAYVILHDHPLGAGADGPTISISTADVDNFGIDTVTDQASIQLKPGERLSEYQLLEGLLVHSANDFAYALALWDAGSLNAFVAKMNADAQSLGMRETHFADASGFSSGSTSTAADLLTVASADMASTAFSTIVDMPAVSLPFVGAVGSYTPLVGTTPGVVGVKSGFTSAAGGGDVLAYQASVDGHDFTVLAAVTSQEGPTVLEAAGKAALALAKAAATHVVADTVLGAGRPVGRVAVGGHRVAAIVASPVTLLAMAGGTVRQSVDLRRPKARSKAGTLVGSATFGVGDQVVSVPVVTAAPLR